MNAGAMRKKMALMREGTTLYIYWNGEFLPIDCVRVNEEDEEAYIIPIKSAPDDSKK